MKKVCKPLKQKKVAVKDLIVIPCKMLKYKIKNAVATLLHCFWMS